MPVIKAKGSVNYGGFVVCPVSGDFEHAHRPGPVGNFFCSACGQVLPDKGHEPAD